MRHNFFKKSTPKEMKKYSKLSIEDALCDHILHFKSLNQLSSLDILKIQEKKFNKRRKKTGLFY